MGKAVIMPSFNRKRNCSISRNAFFKDLISKNSKYKPTLFSQNCTSGYLFLLKIFFICFIYLRGREKERGSESIFTSAHLLLLGNSTQDFHRGYQDPKYLNHHLLQPKVCTSRKLEVVAQLGLTPRHSDRGLNLHTDVGS